MEFEERSEEMLKKTLLTLSQVLNNFFQTLNMRNVAEYSICYKFKWIIWPKSKVK